MSRFAGVWTYAGFTATAVSTTPTKLAPWEAGEGVGLTADETTGGLIIKVPGYYVGYCMVSFIGTTGITYFFELRVNDVVGSGFRACADGLTGGATNVAVMGGARLHEGDVVSLYVYCDEDGESLTVVDGQLGLFSM